ncbi:MAG: TonB-dependent receptor [Haliscomenobacter sp.]|nr:TonB-dependent receptor [Haliscomenobacter sp.]
MTRRIAPVLALFFVLFFLVAPRAQEDVHAIFRDRSYTFSGQVKTMDGQVMKDVNVKVRETKQGVTTDENGFFSLTLKTGAYNLEFSFVGYKTKVVPLELKLNLNMVVRLEESLEVLEEVTITEGGSDRNTQSAEQGIAKLGVQRIRELPTLLGESDVIRSIQTLPGVASVGEGATGFNVRGGNADQNLILVDDIPLFNATHLIGLYSAINPDLLRDVTLYRSGMPARFGGRASSVLDARLREPARDGWHVRGSAGLISSRLLVEGPAIKDKLFLAAGARISYADYFFRWVLKPELKDTEANFSELTLKAVYKPNELDQVALTVFRSRDAFRLAGDSLSTLEVNATSTRFRWINEGASLKWNTYFSEKWGLSLLATFSRYLPGFEVPNLVNASEFEASVSQVQGQAEWKYFAEKHEVAAGVQTSRYSIHPGELQPVGAGSAINPKILPQERGLEAVVYISDDWTISENLRASGGLRLNSFSFLGPADVYQYSDPAFLDLTTISDTIRYGKGKPVQRYAGLEPRFSLRLNLGEQTSLKAGYQRAYQYLHLISNTTSALPTDRWKLSDSYLKPQIADQASIGLFRNFLENAVETSLEFFYKQMEHIPDYRSGANLLLLEAPETAILQGKGKAYGMEFSLRKKGARLEGAINYTYSRAEIRINSPYPEDRFLTGESYPANFNRPHLLNVNMLYRFNRRLFLSANFTYQSGRPATLPEDRYEVGNFFLPNYTSRNETPAPAFHRLDLGLTLEPDPRLRRKYKDRWIFSVYNVYARKNPYSLFVETINSRPISTANRAKIYQLSIIGTLVPSVSYEFEF